MADEEKFYDEEEAVASTPTQRNWKGIIIACLVIAFVLGMIVTSVILLTPPDNGPRIKGERITLADVLEQHLKIREFNGSWISDTEFAYMDSSGGISIFNALNLTTRVLVSNHSLESLKIDGFNISADGQFVLLYKNIKEVRQSSTVSIYYVFDSERNHFRELTHTPGERGHPPLVHAKWAPVGSGIVMVDTNFDIHFKESARDILVYWITNTGIPGVVYNGVPNFVYSEEILDNNHATWFSPNGRLLAFITFNDSLVDEVPIVHYDRESQYPIVTTVRYPKAGQKNPKVTLWVVDLKDPRNPQMRDVKPPNVVKDQLVNFTVWDHYITTVTWVDNSILSVIWMNRAQNVSVITLCHPPKYYCKALRTINSQHGWVDLYDPPIFSKDGQSFLIRLPVPIKDAGEFKHVNLYKTRIVMMNPLTHGPYEVTDILGWDQDNNYIYFLGTAEDRPGERHFYRVSDVSPLNLQLPECLSCFELENSTDRCLYSKAHLSKDYSYFILECLGPDVPRTYLLSSFSLQILQIINNYDSLREKINSSALPEIKTFKVKLDDESKYTAQVQLMLPPGLREDEITTYPMVVHAFGSPGSQSVTSRLHFEYGTYLASKKNYIYAFIDGRGSGYQGEKLKHEVYLSLGKKEIMDQLNVIKYLRENLFFIDQKRIMIWGKGYGGYMSIMALAKDSEDLLCCAIAVAPVINWNHYDSLFTERYMGSPREYHGSNYIGYGEADATKMAEKLKDKKFLLIHGTADRNVHYHHSMMFSKALTENGVLYEQIIYPDEDHSLSGVQEHLYKSMDKFISSCFRPSVEELYHHIKKKKDLEEIGYL